MRVRRIEVTPEGREGCFLPDVESLKAWLKGRFEQVHNFSGGSRILIGADWPLASVLECIDASDRVALLTGDAMAGNIGHALACIVPEGYRGLPERLEMFDIGDVESALVVKDAVGP